MKSISKIRFLLAAFCAAFAAQAQTVNVVNAVTNGATSVSGEYTLTGVGGVTYASLSLEADAKWTFDPIRTPVFVGAVPTFAEGAKIALAANYTDAAYQNGRLTLFTWAGAAEADVPAGLLDATTVPAGANPVLMQETYTSRKGGASSAETTYTRLVLDMNPSATRPTITILPLGDSLTENSSIGGMHANPNYRVNLLKKLAAHGWTPKSVGYRHSANLDSAGIGQPEEWSWHNGMSGNRLVPVYTGLGHPKTVSGYRESLEPMIESCESPDVILFMIGANDSNGVGYTMDELYASWTNVLWRLIRMRPATRIICSPTLYMSAPTGAWETEWTARITQAIGGGRNEPGFPSGHVFFADVRSSCPRVDDAGNYLGYFMTKTDVHPNWIGHDLTSDAWLAAIEEAMKAGRKPSFTQDMRPLLETWFGFNFTKADAAASRDAKAGTKFAGKNTTEDMDAIYLTKADVDALRDAFYRDVDMLRKPPKRPRFQSSTAAIRIMSAHAGVGWTSGSHTALPVLTTSTGVGADAFTGLLDNTEISRRLKAFFE